MAKHWTWDTAFTQLESCNFKCEGGPLENNVAYLWLKKALQIGPKFLPGQGVYYTIVTDIKGFRLEKRAHFYVVGVWMDSTKDAQIWKYAISDDPPTPYHYGQTKFQNVAENLLSDEEGVS